MVSCSGLALLASGIVPELSAQFELVYLEPEVSENERKYREMNSLT